MHLIFDVPTTSTPMRHHFDQLNTQQRSLAAPVLGDSEADLVGA